jgi:hypothetical protein
VLIAASREQKLKRKANRPVGTEVIGILDIVKALQRAVNGSFADAKYATDAASQRDRPVLSLSACQLAVISGELLKYPPPSRL